MSTVDEDDDVIVKSIVLVCDRARAFHLFTDRVSEWWPLDRRHIKGDAVMTLTRDGLAERAVDGRVVEVGRVRAWDAPSRLELDWFPGASADDPTFVIVTFVAEGERTRVTVEHRVHERARDRIALFRASWDAVLTALSSQSP
ncbi:MAG TPA: SRPBCC domain-containing protein [Myxococcota bacterium]|jgi:hypothetical protein